MQNEPCMAKTAGIRMSFSVTIVYFHEEFSLLVKGLLRVSLIYTERQSHDKNIL